MPYIPQEHRDKIDAHIDSLVDMTIPLFTKGMANYVISKLMDKFFFDGYIQYERINDAIGVLECCKLEVYRRLAAPYEDKKKNINGDVFEEIK